MTFYLLGAMILAGMSAWSALHLARIGVPKANYKELALVGFSVLIGVATFYSIFSPVAESRLVSAAFQLCAALGLGLAMCGGGGVLGILGRKLFGFSWRGIVEALSAFSLGMGLLVVYCLGYIYLG